MKATVISVNKRGIKRMLALIVEPRRKMALKYLTLLEEADEEVAAMERNSKEFAEIVANNVTKKAVAGRRKKMPT